MLQRCNLVVCASGPFARGPFVPRRESDVQQFATCSAVAREGGAQHDRIGGDLVKPTVVARTGTGLRELGYLGVRLGKMLEFVPSFLEAGRVVSLLRVFHGFQELVRLVPD